MPYNYDRRAAKPSEPFNHVEWVIAEVLEHRTGGQTVRALVEDYLRGLTASSQELHELIRKRVKESCAEVQGGDEITKQDIERALYEGVVRQAFGEDALAKLLVKVLANGDFVY